MSEKNRATTHKAGDNGQGAKGLQDNTGSAIAAFENIMSSAPINEILHQGSYTALFTGSLSLIATIYPHTEVQHCIIHQIRNSLKYVASKNQKAFMADLKSVYKAATIAAAETALDELETQWGERYPVVLKSWRTKWQTLSAYFKYPDSVRTAIYTTNAVEAVHRQFRKLTKTMGGFANENSLLKLLYVGMLKASERWTHPIQNWNLTLFQLTIHFPGRLDKQIEL